MADSLQRFVEEVSGTGHLRVEHDFGDGFVRLQTSEAERRQAAQDIKCSEDIVLELLRNSRDAHAKHVFVAMSKEGAKRTITVVDDGDGIPEHMHRLVFEPRVTSKLDTSHRDAWGLHGRGMALYSIATNAAEARIASSAPTLGTAITVRTDTATLPERADQSSFPSFELGDDGTVNVRGPRNILRTVCEFAIDSRSACSIHVGSPAEVAAALYDYGSATLSAIDRLFCDNAEEVPLVKRLATAAAPEQLAALAAHAGLDISTRTARRIIDGEVSDAPAILDRIEIGAHSPRRTRTAKSKAPADARGLKLHPQDSAVFLEAVSRAYSDIAEKYYLEAGVKPSMRVTRDRISISLPVVKKP